MIVLYGSTGSGKTTTAMELEQFGMRVVPTYTTRPPRKDDFGTIATTEEIFQEALKANKIFTQTSYNATFGKCRYWLMKSEFSGFTEDTVLVGNYEFSEAINKWDALAFRCRVFNVFIKVDYDIIVERDRNEKRRIERMDRLRRDDYKMKELEANADLIINNQSLQLNKTVVADLIMESYDIFLKERGVKNEANAGNYI